MLFHENSQPADDSHKTIMPYLLFFKKKQNNLISSRLLQIIGGALWDNKAIFRINGKRVCIARTIVRR